VDQSYLRLRIEQDTHLKFTQDYLLDPATKVHQTLSTYRSVLKGECIENNEQSSVHSRLKLAGVVRAKDGLLEPRNRIYQNVFNLPWVQEHQPVNFHKWIYGAASGLALVLLAFALFFFVHSPMAEGSKLGRPLRVGIVSWPGYAGGIVANNGFKPNKECIYFKNHKQMVEFLLLEDPAVRSHAFAKGEGGVDIVWSTVDYWANELPGFINHGVKARAIMQVDWSRGGDAIVADESIKSIEDLKDKKISLVKYTPSHWLLEYHLENSGLSDYDQKKIIDNLVNEDSTRDARQAFKNKQVDATVVWEPDLTLALERPGSHILVSTETANNLIANVMVAREDFIKDHPDVIKEFIQGWLEGTAEAVRNPDKVVQLLMENEPLYGDMKDQKVKDSLKTVKYADLADNTMMFGLDGSKPLFDQLFTTAGAAWVRSGYISQRLSPDQAKDISFLKEIYTVSPVPRPVEATLPPPPSDKTGGTSTKPVDILFDSGQSLLSASARQAIDNNVALLAETNSNAYIRVSGNTDNTGGRSGNIALSKARAEEVVKYLVERYQLNRARFIVEGNGSDKPRAPNHTPDGQAKNRRTDIEIIPVR
jgi:NitT/TauT family transport system substrate-binding protein